MNIEAILAWIGAHIDLLVALAVGIPALIAHFSQAKNAAKTLAQIEAEKLEHAKREAFLRKAQQCAEQAHAAVAAIAAKTPNFKGDDKIATALGFFSTFMRQYNEHADDNAIEIAKALFTKLHWEDTKAGQDDKSLQLAKGLRESAKDPSPAPPAPGDRPESAI